VYFDELVRHTELDTLAVSESVTRAAHSNHVTPAGTRHQSRASTPPEAVVSPTDLSMRRDRSNVVDGTFTSPSSGFDSPSMHAGCSSGTPAVDGTAGSGCSDNSAAADADRSESYVVSPSSPSRATAPSTETAHKHVSRTIYMFTSVQFREEQNLNVTCYFTIFLSLCATHRPVASLRLVSSGAVTDGVTLLYLKSNDLFSRRPTNYRHHSHTLRLSRWLFIKCSCKFIPRIFRLSLGCHPLDGVTSSDVSDIELCSQTDMMFEDNVNVKTKCNASVSWRANITNS